MTVATKQHIILCVDDDADDLFFITTAVQRTDSTLHTATAYNGEEALRYLEEAKQSGHIPSLIILDINMPRMGGKETLVRIKTDPQLKTIPVVVYTTSSSHLDRTFCNHYGVPMVTKPVKYDDIMASVQGMLSLLGE